MTNDERKRIERLRKNGNSFNSAHTLEAQSAFLKKWITSTSGWVDGGVFIDLGITGTKTDRPGFRALMEKCEEGGVDIIVTKSISRFCRNTVDSSPLLFETTYFNPWDIINLSQTCTRNLIPRFILSI